MTYANKTKNWFGELRPPNQFLVLFFVVRDKGAGNNKIVFCQPIFITRIAAKPHSANLFTEKR
jgi:hypothetical protein